MVPNIIMVPSFLKPNATNGLSYDLLKNLKQLKSVLLANDFGKYLAYQVYYYQKAAGIFTPVSGDTSKTTLPTVTEVIDPSIFAFRDELQRITQQLNPIGLTAYELEARLVATQTLKELLETNADSQEPSDNPANTTGESSEVFTENFLHFDGYHYFVELIPTTGDATEVRLVFWKNVLLSMDAVPMNVCVRSKAFKFYEHYVHTRANSLIL